MIGIYLIILLIILPATILAILSVTKKGRVLLRRMNLL